MTHIRSRARHMLALDDEDDTNCAIAYPQASVTSTFRHTAPRSIRGFGYGVRSLQHQVRRGPIRPLRRHFATEHAN